MLEPSISVFPSPLAAKAVEIAATQLGVSENPPGSNRGGEVERYLASAGLPPGEPWCAAFAYWCAEQAALLLGLPNPLIKSGSCSAIYRWAKNGGALAGFPVAGDLFLVKGGPTGHKHAGWVASVLREGIETIEGNADAAGSAEGLLVMRRRRRAASCDYVRLPN